MNAALFNAVVMTLPCRYTAAMVSTALVTAAIIDTAFNTAVKGGCCLFLSWLLVDAAPFTAVGADAAFIYCS